MISKPVSFAVCLMLTSKYSLLRYYLLFKMPKSKLTRNGKSEFFGPTTRSQNKSTFKNGEEQFIETALMETTGSLSNRISRKMDESKNNQNAMKKQKLEPRWEPNHWVEQFENIRTMRKNKDAPVDTMGCERCTQEGYTEKVRNCVCYVTVFIQV